MNHKALVLQGLCIFLSYVSSYGQAFEQVTDGLPDVGSSSTVWADFDNDGLLDLALSGIDNGNARTADVYLNQGNGTFTALGAGIEAISDGAMATGDVNNDGWLDLVVTGVTTADQRQTTLYRNDGDGTFTVINAGLEGVAFSDVAFADYNYDGRQDLFLLGVNGSGERVTKLYTNLAEGFAESQVELDGVSQGSLLARDFNKDGFIDLLYHGVDNANQPVIYYYLNDKTGSFTLSPTSLPDLGNGKATTGDINQDGFPDLLLAGSRFGTSFTQAYLNNSGSTFTPYLSLPGTVEGTGGYGDYDNDGDADLFYSGLEGTVFKSYLYNNDPTQLTNSGLAFPGVSGGEAHFADYNNDGKPDLFLTGYTVTAPASNLYQNTQANVNTVPTAPSGLTVQVYNDSAVFSWGHGSDAETATNGLTYNLYIGTAPLHDDVMAAQAELGSGWRKIAAPGVQTDTFAVVKDLPEGEYFWAVQTIDQATAGSPFSTEAVFYVCYDLQIEAQRIGCGDRMALSYTGARENDVVAWYSGAGPATPFSEDQEVELTVSQDTDVWAIVSRSWGCEVRADITVAANPETRLDTGGDRSICIGDTLVLGGSPTAQGSFLPYSYQWSPGEAMDDPTAANPRIWPKETTTYQLITFSGGCEVAQSTVTITVDPLPGIDAGDDLAIGLNETTQLLASGGETYVWSPTEGLSDTISATPVAQPLQTTTYSLTGTDINGCVNQDSVTVKVRSELFVPNLFTPNQDGVNDIFYVYGTGVMEVQWAVYDRNGQELFTSNDIHTGWDGTANGNELPTGHYLWTVKGRYFDGRPLDFNGKNKGTIRLVR